MTKTKKDYSKNKLGLSRDIPDPIKREVRKRCGFGCVMCGLGLYEYEHFDPQFKKAKVHDPNGITLLCPNHHSKKTKGRYDVEVVNFFNKSPKALRQGFAKDNFLLTNNPVIKLGQAVFTNTDILLQIDDEPIISTLPGEDEYEPMQLTATLRDRSGAIIMDIDKNEWKTSTDNWDCYIHGKKIEIRSAPREIELVIRQESPQSIVVERLRMVHRGCIIEAYEGRETSFTPPTGVKISTPRFVMNNFTVGIHLNGTRLQIGYIGEARPASKGESRCDMDMQVH